MDIVVDGAYKKALTSSQFTANSHNLKDYSQVPAMNKDGSVTTLDKVTGGVQGGGSASNAAPPVGIPHDVIVNGKVVGVTMDGGKTMKPVGAQ